MSNCRFCSEVLEIPFIDLGMSPLANSFISLQDLDKPERLFPLKVMLCKKCFLVQLEEYEKPEDIFTDYIYFSSYSKSWLEHAMQYVDMIIERFKFNDQSKIIELASNDGYLLQYFVKRGFNVLGIEPAKNVAEKAVAKGVPTLQKFFNTDTAEELVSEGTKAELVIANNVIAHVPNLNDFIKAIKIILKDNGIFTAEFPHLMELIDKNQFDTIYHEHFSYFSFYTINQIFKYHGLKIFDVEKILTHGGSLRVYVTHEDNELYSETENIRMLLTNEIEFGLGSPQIYIEFTEKVEKIKKDMRDLLIRIKTEGKKISAYSAPAKGNTLLNYCEIGNDIIDYTADLNPSKQGTYLPGTKIPVYGPEIIKKTRPDYLVILSWNIKEEIMEQMSFIRDWGGKFIIPIPEVSIIN